MRSSLVISTLVLLMFWSTGYSQPKDNAAVKSMVEKFKSDDRGPYKDIRWFCKDGTTLPPKERCPEKGGVQRARYKDEVVALANSNGIYLGQILSTTPHKDFWDEPSFHSRLKQFQMQQFLRESDDGWVSRKAQFYRGAFQIEDEEAWGIEFYKWLLDDPKLAAKQFFLIRQSVKDIPHAAETNTALSVRALSKEIADLYAPFMNLRVKIHGQPESGDLERVIEFRTSNKDKYPAVVDSKFTALIQDMKTLYKPIESRDFENLAKQILPNTGAQAELLRFAAEYGKTSTVPDKCKLITSSALTLRKEVNSTLRPTGRLALFDASVKLEGLLLQQVSSWKPKTLKEQMEMTICLVSAAAAFGYIELWELETVLKKLTIPNNGEIWIADLEAFVTNVNRTVEWGIGMFRANYGDVVKLYAGFEPLANGFVDDKARSSILLQLGEAASVLGDFSARESDISNKVFRIPNQSSIRGLNSGYAMGELVVTDQSPDELEVASDKIYVFNRPPSDLKPVAGIATVTEGNMVSHVQLLARNLGIPNAVLSAENLKALLPFNGKKVFYAVSPRGRVIMKLATEMSEVEKALFTKKARSEEKITVPIDRMNLKDARVLNLREVDASQSGKVCGPKAANLGQLKKLYPENVVEGLVIPFAVFKEHFNQLMPQQGKTFWEYLNATFEKAGEMKKEGKPSDEIEKFVLGNLSTLQTAIKKIPLSASFQAQLKAKFKEVFGKELGSVPVFIRSDTNMEDLKDFTGAGLNLTLFNVLEADKILQGIKDVWASPYSERSYKWRQSYLLNPENVFPSILIIPTVNADYSGVLITKGVATGKSTDITVAFNRGVGGAVEGQSSESWVMNDKGNTLASPAREPEFITVPKTGGTAKEHTDFSERLLSTTRLKMLKDLTASLNAKLPSAGVKGPYDVELGFKDDKVWLFQVRPFVENKRAVGSDYLQSLSPKTEKEIEISLDTKIQ